MMENAPNVAAAAYDSDAAHSHLLARLSGGADAFTRVVLAPLSGITDMPFRRLVRSFGLKLAFSEMIASGELIKGHEDSRLRMAPDGEGCHAIQLAGREANAMRLAAQLAAAEGAELIDINMGCPAKKVVGGASGSALMRDLDHALRLIEATLEGAGRVPVSLKMRLGWDRQSLNAPELAARAQMAGVAWVTVHGRTRDQFYEGRADWFAISEVKEAVTIPVIANGDLVSRMDHPIMLAQSGADAVMIGRGVCGRPWFPAYLAGCAPADLASHGLADLICSHYEAMLSHYGAAAGLRHARKHLGWYLDRIGTFDAQKALLLRETEPSHVLSGLQHLLAGLTIGDADPDLRTLRKAA
ncbi:tRNA dihydrouridine synthase [Aureimonas ureilytica]|nr:tRNA-dihydrouridine synthase [Aureimonas ureilytica]